MLSPLASLLVCIRFFKSNVSQFFILVFAFYFGYHCGFVWDLMNHYVTLPFFYGRGMSEILSDPRVYVVGNDHYHIFAKYIFTRFSMSRQLFGAYACVIYTFLLLFFMRQLSEYYHRALSACEVACMLLIAFTVEYYWYQGFRFWPGVFFFLGFYLKYLRTSRIMYLCIASLCFLVHFSLFTLAVVAWGEFVLCRVRFKYRIVAACLSLVTRVLTFDFATWAYTNISFLTSYGNKTFVASRQESVYNTTASYREHINQFYNHRDDLIIVFGIIVIWLLRRYGAKFPRVSITLFGFFLTMFTLANIGYGSISFYMRFLKMSAVILYTGIFVAMSVNYKVLLKHRIMLLIMILIPLLYALATQFVQQRFWLFSHADLLLGNFFTDFDGNNFRHGDLVGS